MGDFADIFAALKPVLARHEHSMSVKTDTAVEYTLVTRSASPFPQHKGQPLFFGSVRMGRAYVSFHLMPLYMCPPLLAAIPGPLKKRMQGKTCFNFKNAPEAELMEGLERLTTACLEEWRGKGWL